MGRKQFCIKFADNVRHEKFLREECDNGFLLRNVDRCVRVEGVTTINGQVGMVMNRCAETMDEFITRVCKARGGDGWENDLLQWSAEEIVLGVMGMHNAGVVHGDMKLSNMGLCTRDTLGMHRDATRPWKSQIIQLFDFGMRSMAVSAGTYPFRASDWSTNPEQLLCGNAKLDQSVTYRRSDWFQSLMVVFDIAYRACTHAATTLHTQWHGRDKADQPRAVRDAKQVGDKWIASGRQGGWLNCIINARRKTNKIPATLVELYSSSEGFRKLDTQLTTNFKTCV
jgi:serine/threonine protein kinase